MFRSNLVPGASDVPTQSVSVQSPMLEEDALAQVSCIFSDVVSMRIKPAGRDEYMAMVTVRLRPDNAVHPRSLLLELTDESDLFFYHSLLLGEGDFHTLKSEQRLLVDFQSFPSQLVELLRRCMEGNDSPPASTQPAHIVNSSTNLRMLACLDCGSGGDSVFSIIESNQFRELTYISLRLRQGTDETVKKHLATKLRGYRTESADLAERLRSSEEVGIQLRRQVEELTGRIRTATDERSQLEQSLDASRQREVADLKQEQARAILALQQTASEERSRMEAQLREALTKMTARAETAERSNEEFQQQVLALTSSGKGYRERLETTDAQLQEARQETKVLREQQKQLELLKFQHEREIGERGVRMSSLQEQLANKEQLVTNQASQLEQAGAQRKALEDSLVVSKQQVTSLEDKFGLSAQEITKGNQIIQKLRTDIKQLKGKLRLKSEEMAQQGKSVLDLERAEETGRHLAEEKAQELERSKERLERQREDIEELRKKLAEAHEVVRSNQDVIEYLNRQLAERDLKALPPVMAGIAAGAEREPRGNTLADLLKRTEGLSSTLKSTSLNSKLSPSSIAFPTGGLSELGLGSGLSSLGGLGSTSPPSSLVAAGPAASSSAQPSTAGKSTSILGTISHAQKAITADSTASAASNSLAAARYALQGPVAYRSPASNAPIAVK